MRFYFDGIKKSKTKLTAQGKAFKRAMKEAKISISIRDEFLWNHTKYMQQLCKKNPNVTLKMDVLSAGTTPGTRDILITPFPDERDGCRQTCTHEYGHYLANSIFDIQRSHDYNIFQTAVESDIARFDRVGWDKRFYGLCDNSQNQQIVKNQEAQRLFGIKDFEQLNIHQQLKIITHGDILGSISKGDYGFGHDDKEAYIMDQDPLTGAKNQIFRQTFANIYLAYKYGWTEFKTNFPAIWQYMEDLLNGKI